MDSTISHIERIRTWVPCERVGASNVAILHDIDVEFAFIESNLLINTQ